MDPTPFEQEVVAVATNLTLVPTVLLLDGLDTVTPANAELATAMKTEMAVIVKTRFFIWAFLSGWDYLVWDR
jgi:hypothetical protein